MEWLQSPIVYRDSGTMAKRLRELLSDYHSPIASMYHYLHMAQGNYRQYLQGETVWVKKYFYVLRPVLACLWIEKDYGFVPTEFEILFDRTVTEPFLREAIEKLLLEKKQGEELKVGERIPVLSDFLNIQLERLAAKNIQPSLTKDPNVLDELFLELLIETNGKRMDEL